MSEAVLNQKRSPLYTIWVSLLLVTAALGIYTYLEQLEKGLTITGMSRDVSWGFYISNFTFLVGVAASAVMLVIPAYLHNYKDFKGIVIFGEWVAVSAVTMCLMFILADMGQPQRAFNILLHPTPNSILFWDTMVLFSYLALNLILGWRSVQSLRSGIAPPPWVKKAVILSVPLAVGIHTVTAFLYAGLPGRHFWLTAIMAPRFLASAFASGPAFLFAILFILERRGLFQLSDSAFATLRKIITYAMITNLFFLFLEFFTAGYSGVPSHQHTLEYLYFGLDGKSGMVPWAWLSMGAGFAAIAMLLTPAFQTSRPAIAAASLLIFLSTYVDKGLLLVIGGFIPNSMGRVVEYKFTGAELMISAGIWAIGLLCLTFLFRFTIKLQNKKGRVA